MTSLTVLAVLAVVLVVLFDYTNGFHDASNIIATVIASRAMTPIQAVVIVATFEFLGPLLGGTAVANTIGKFVELGDVEARRAILIILAGLIGAIAWNLGTWWFGIPSSSSHALTGGLCGAVVASVGAGHVIWGFGELGHGHVTGVTKVLMGLLLSPIIGFLVGFVLQKVSALLLSRARPSANTGLRRAQWLTSAWLAFSHGANDAQKSMGILTLVLLLSGRIADFSVPFWVMLLCASAITLGILSGGWRIVRTVGFGIYKIRPIHALDAQLTSAGVIYAASLLGAPVSTTHVVSSSIMGIGAADRARDVRWSKAKEILTTWLVTIPGSAAVSVVAILIFRLFW